MAPVTAASFFGPRLDFRAPRRGVLHGFTHPETSKAAPGWCFVRAVAWRRERGAAGPVVVTERQAHPVELAYQAFLRMNSGQKQRLHWRIARSPR